MHILFQLEWLMKTVTVASWQNSRERFCKPWRFGTKYPLAVMVKAVGMNMGVSQSNQYSKLSLWEILFCSQSGTASRLTENWHSDWDIASGSKHRLDSSMTSVIATMHMWSFSYLLETNRKTALTMTITELEHSLYEYVETVEMSVVAYQRSISSSINDLLKWCLQFAKLFVLLMRALGWRSSRHLQTGDEN